jgi:Na+-transporting NADH:ubiquinone oxidoreductase subunit C
MKNIKSIAFISILSLFCVISLTYVYEYSRPIIEENERMDVVKNVLYSFDISFSDDMARSDIRSIFEENVEKNEIEGLSYYINEKEGEKKYSFPIVAKGLWGLIYGFVSLNSDLKTVYRVTFSKHQETPGLGALIDEESYKKRYHNVSLYDKDGDFGIMSKKNDGKSFINSVDSITGATLTSEGVVTGINDSLRKYFKLLK